MTTTHPDGRAGIDATLVRRLIAAQFPRWQHLPVTPVPIDGWDNRTYRLGAEMSVRLPTAEGYVAAVEKERTWLPRLAPHLPVAVPEVLGSGVPGEGYPFPWSVRGWLPGTPFNQTAVTDLPGLAVAVAEFIQALQRCDPTGGPTTGAHCFHRGASPAYYDDETRRFLVELEGRIDVDKARDVWETALAAEWRGAPVWFHGDIAPGNLLITDDALSAVIDFGTAGVGDPACELVIAWTTFHGKSRQAFKETTPHDDGTWARARGWAIWKAMLLAAADTNAAENLRVIDEIIDDHVDRA
ncbi:aminoglycoside phosphotransferase family protein [Actinokineospora auranticolor]|uniref:aminoglycoside phosphotransferase family protein n=1 Tax=Actinokineospora auranticolor TaxID=155976 RepID=UPI000CECE114|nr:aminoglycoside phosphotransferase family protein [Actinokineospora auranticolor]